MRKSANFLKNKGQRYYYHRKVKDFAVIRVRSREIHINDGLIAKLNPVQKRQLFRLRDQFGYNLQYTIS